MLRKSGLELAVLVLLTIIFTAVAFGGGPNDWTHYGHTTSRHSIAVDGPNVIDANEWVAWEDPCYPGCDIEFVGPSSPVVYDDKVYAYAKYFDSNENYINNQIIAFDVNSGQTLWATVVDKAVSDSWSSPCIDIKNENVLIGSGKKVFALGADSGAIVWSTQLDRSIVNASVCVASDLPFARAFITDFTGSASVTGGKLYCINLDPNTPGNRYEPGDIVWSDTIGATSGNTSAYKDGVVYVACIKSQSGSWGAIYAYDANAAAATKLWQCTDPNFEGFFGGVTVTKAGYLYAANYDFGTGQDNSTLCKIGCNDGDIVWLTQTERTDSMPIVVGDKIYICGGLVDYGRPKVEAYQDNGPNVVKLWETPESLIIGGWTHQPAYADGKLYVGAIPTGGYFFDAYTDLYILDTSLAPNDSNFIIDSYSGCGSSPVVTYNSIYSIGKYGLHKFYQEALLADSPEDGRVDMVDLADFVEAWLFDGAIGIKRSDLNLDGIVNMTDFAMLAKEWLEDIN